MTPGEAAYEAFTKTLGAHRLKGDERAECYGKLPRLVTQAWEAAANAASEQMQTAEDKG